MDISAVLTVAAEIAGAAGLVDVTRRAYDWLHDRARIQNDVDEAKELLGIRRGWGVAYRHDSVHALYSGGIELHPDNLAALTTAAGSEFARARDLRLVRHTSNIKTTLNTNLVLIGSPTAEGLSRPLFGYEPDVDPDSLALIQAPVDLPIRWVLSKSQIDEHARAKRFVAGRGLVSRPNWRIDAGDRLYVPEVDVFGFISMDYLVVTRLRNYLSTQALDQGKYIISFGGAHGTATRAIEILLRDHETLRKISERLSDRPAAYQMLLRVGAMQHDRLLGTRATQVELVGEPIILPDNQQTWSYAANIAKNNLERWLSSQNRS